MPKRKLPEPDTLLKMPVSEFLALCTLQKGTIEVSFNRMMELLARAKGKQSVQGPPQHQLQLDKLHAEVNALKAQAKAKPAKPDAAAAEDVEDAEPNKEQKEAGKKKEKKKHEG